TKMRRKMSRLSRWRDTSNLCHLSASCRFLRTSLPFKSVRDNMRDNCVGILRHRIPIYITKPQCTVDFAKALFLVSKSDQLLFIGL
ncbi:hypothetical protein SK128_005821, partial [Halocaridina rubra]